MKGPVMTMDQFRKLPKYVQAYISELGEAEWKTWSENVDLKALLKAQHSSEEARARHRAETTRGGLNALKPDVAVVILQTEDATVAEIDIDGTFRASGTAKRLPGDPRDLKVGQDLAMGRALLEAGFRMIAAAEERWSQ